MVVVIPEIVLKLTKIDRNAYQVIKKCFFMVPLGDVTEEQIKTGNVPIISGQMLGSLWILLSVKEVRNMDLILRKRQCVSVLSFLCIFLLLYIP